MDAERFPPLLARARSGDQQAFGELWQSFNPMLTRFLVSMAGRNDADDLASTVWIDVVRSLDVFTGDHAAFRAWLFTLARRRLIDQRRREKRRPRTAPGRADHQTIDDVDPGSLVAGAASTEAALAFIGSLPADQAEIVLLRVVVGLEVNEVAVIVDKKPGTVRVLAHRGLRRLAEQLAARPASPGEDVTR